MTIYRVEKDGVTFYVQPEQLELYASSGWVVYKLVEEQVMDVAVEAADAAATQSATVSSVEG